MPSPVDASPRRPGFMSATKASSSRATNTTSDTAKTTNNAASDNAASNVPSGAAATAAAEDSQPEDEDEPLKPMKSANIPKVTASQRARQYLRWAEAHPCPVVDKDGGNTPKDDDEDRKTVYALIQQIDPSGQKLQSLASLSEEAPGEKKWPASWDISKFGYLKGMIKKDLARWMRQLVPVEEEDEGEVEVAVSPPATIGTGSAQAEQAVAEELVKRVDGLSVGAEVGSQGGLGLELESQPVGAAQVAGGEGGALFDLVGVQTAPPPALTSVPSPAARPQANPQQILQDAFLGVGVQTAPPPATTVPPPTPEPPANRQQSIAHNAWLGAGVEVAPPPAPASAPVNVQPSPGAAPTPATQQSVQYDPAWWQWYRQRHAAKRRAEEEEEDAEFF